MYSQPHFITRKINNETIGIDVAFEYKGTNYNGLDYEKSIESINSEMKQQCNKENTFFIDIDSNNFEFTNDFYDTVHMLPSGNRKLSNIIFKEMKELKIDDKL